MSGVARWSALAAVTAAAGWLLGAVGLPSSYLFGALLAGIGAALRAPERFAIPGRTFTGALAVAGAVLGTLLDRSSLDAVVGGWLPLALVTGSTLAISLVAGAVLARTTVLDVPTAALGMVAGGSSGIVGIAGELGADYRLVAFMQYLRVLLIVLLMPILVAVAFSGEVGSVSPVAVPMLGDSHGWLLTLGTCVSSIVLAATVRFPGAALLAPMIIAAVLTLAVPGGEFTVPPLAREVAFALIGLQVGLKFTLDTIRLLSRLLVPVLVAVFGVLTASGVLAVVLDATTTVSLRDAYLATTPGGLHAVLAVALGTDSNAAFILVAQGSRMIVMVALAPIVIRWIVARASAAQQRRCLSARQQAAPAAAIVSSGSRSRPSVRVRESGSKSGAGAQR